MSNRISERVDLGALSEQLLFGCLPEKQATAFNISWEPKLKDAERELLEQLECLSLEAELNEEIQDIIYLFLAMAGPVYFELGMKAGAALACSLEE